jgi:hypothetical protein
MKLSTGKTAIKVPFDNGDVGVVYINTTDRTIQERINAFEGRVEEKIKSINLDKYNAQLDGGIKADITNIDALFEMSADELEKLNGQMTALNEIDAEYNKVVKEELDEVFKSPVSDVFFKYCQPFDVVVIEDDDGNEKREMYIMHLLKWLGYELKKNAEKNNSAMNKHIGKYVKNNV